MSLFEGWALARKARDDRPFGGRQWFGCHYGCSAYNDTFQRCGSDDELVSGRWRGDRTETDTAIEGTALAG